MSDKLKFLKRIAKLGSQGYEPTQEVTLVELFVNAMPSHQRPAIVYVRQSDGATFVNDTYLHDLEQDLAALIASCGIKTDGRPLHELVPYAAQRIGEMDEFYNENYEEPTDEPAPDDEDVPEDANTD